MPKLYRFLEAPEHILAGDEIWTHRASEWRTVSPDFIDTEYSDWMPPVRRATAPQANTVALSNNSSAPLNGHIFVAVPQAGAPYLPCPICKGVEGCDHTVPERRRAAVPQPSLPDAAITACALMIKGICMTHPQEQWSRKIEERIRCMLGTQP